MPQKRHPRDHNIDPMDAAKPYKFTRFGAMDAAKPYKFTRFGAMDAAKPYKFIGVGPTPGPLLSTPPGAGTSQYNLEALKRPAQRYQPRPCSTLTK